MTKSKKLSLPSDVVTKTDLGAMEKRMGAKFSTKQELAAMEKRMGAKFATKDDLKQGVRDLVTKDELEIKFTNFGRDLDEKLDERFSKFKSELKVELTKDIVEGVNQDLRDLLGPHLDMVDRHDGRIKTLERHTSHPPLAQAIA